MSLRIATLIDFILKVLQAAGALFGAVREEAGGPPPKGFFKKLREFQIASFWMDGFGILQGGETKKTANSCQSWVLQF